MIIRPSASGNIFLVSSASTHALTPPVQISPSGSGFTRRGFFATALAGIGSLGACKGKEKTAFTDDIAARKVRARRKALLNGYLLRQSVADTSKVDKILLREEILDNPALLGVSNDPSFVEQIRLRKDALNTLCIFKFIPQRSGRTAAIEVSRSPLIVTIPGKRIELTQGTQSERNSFDSMFYHEVEGHGTDRAVDSPYSRVLAKIYQLLEHSDRRMALMMPLFDIMTEFSAYLKELNRLIEKLNYHRNPGVIEPWARTTTEGELADHAIRLLKLTDETSHQWKVLKEGGAIKTMKMMRIVRHFSKIRFRSVSPRTRAYTIKLIRNRGYIKPVPW